MKHYIVPIVLVALVTAASTAAAASLSIGSPQLPTATHSISTSGNSHGPQVLVNTLQPADRPVFTVTPTPDVATASQLQPTVNPQR